ncbi:hypothetical protein [Streptomyces sp. NPDC001781]
MCERLDGGEDEDPEVVRRRFDADLGTGQWLRVPGEVRRYADAEADPAAPWWWEGDEEASASFLAAQGVSL